jgi:hypothetical protein
MALRPETAWRMRVVYAIVEGSQQVDIAVIIGVWRGNQAELRLTRFFSFQSLLVRKLKIGDTLTWRMAGEPEGLGKHGQVPGVTRQDLALARSF